MLKEISQNLSNIIQASVKKLELIKEEDASVKPAPDKWSKKEILGHLIDSASNNHQRFVRAQQTEQLLSPDYAQDFWNEAQDYNNKPWKDIIELWVNYNHHLAFIIERIPEEKINNLIKIGEGEAHTLLYIMEDYVTHLKHHLKQIGIE